MAEGSHHTFNIVDGISQHLVHNVEDIRDRVDIVNTSELCKKPVLEVIISHTADSHIQSLDDSVVAAYKPSYSASQELVQKNQQESNEIILIEDGTSILQMQNSEITDYRKKTQYYGPLKVCIERLKIIDNDQEKEVLKTKLIHLKNLTKNDICEGLGGNDELLKDMDKIPGIIPACEPPGDDSKVKDKGEIIIETYDDCNREMFPVNFEDNDVINISKNAIDEFRKISDITEPLRAQRERIFRVVDGKEIPVTIVHLFSDARNDRTECHSSAKVGSHDIEQGKSKEQNGDLINGQIKKEVESIKVKEEHNPGQNRDLLPTLDDKIIDLEDGGISGFGCEAGIVVNLNISSSHTDVNAEGEISKEDLLLLEIQPAPEDVNAHLTSEDVWKYLTQYASDNNNRVQALVTQFNNESWLEVKRMSDFYQVDGEVMTDLSFKVVYKDILSPVTYFLRGFSRLLKTGELSTSNDVNHLFHCMSRDRKLCLGLKPSPYQHSIDNNIQVRQFFKEKGQFVSTPFECLLSKACRGVVKVNDSAPSSTFTRGTKTVLGVHALCRACALLGKKMNQLIKVSPKNSIRDDDEMQEKMMGDSFMQLLRQPIRRNGMSFSALKYLFTQNIPEILSRKGHGSNQSGVNDVDIDEESPLTGKRKKPRLSQKEEVETKSSIGVTESSFLSMIDFLPPSSEGLGRSLVKKCNVCQFRAPTMLSLMTHMKGHLGVLKEKCSECEITLSSKEALEMHKRQMHTERSPVCATCQLDFTTNDQWFDHMNKHRKHHAFECPICNYKLTNKEAYKKHLRLTHKITSVKELGFNCKTCNIYFYTQDHVLLHRINQNHEGIEPFKCKTCAACCVTANEFRHHILEHSEEEREAANLAICPECYKVFFSIYRLTYHLETKHAKASAKVEPQVVVEPNVPVPLKKKKSRGPYLRYLRANEKYKCSSCNRRFKTHETLENHMKFAHAVKKVSKTEFKCSLCGRKFNVLRRLGNHMKIHSGNRPVFQCEECGQIYGKKTQVLEHIRIDHAEQVERHQQQQELIQVDQSQEQQFVDIQVQQQSSCIEGSATTSWSPIKSPFKVPTVEQTQEAVYSLLQLTDF